MQQPVSRAKSTHVSTNMTISTSCLDEPTVHGYWGIAEELHGCGFTVAAVHVLQSLVDFPIPASLAGADVSTRLRLANLALSASMHPEIARRALEPARDLAQHHSVDVETRAEIVRLLGVCARRKHHHKLSVSCIEEGLHFVSQERMRRGSQLSESIQQHEALLYLELARTWYAKLTATHPWDLEAAHQLLRVSSEYGRFALMGGAKQAAIAMTLCVCHIYGLMACGRHEDMSTHFKQASALFSHVAEFTVWKSMVDFLNGDCGPLSLPQQQQSSSSSTAPIPAAGDDVKAELCDDEPSSPLKKRLRSDSLMAAGSGDEAPSGVFWLSEGSFRALENLLELIRAGVGNSPPLAASSQPMSTNTAQVPAAPSSAPSGSGEEHRFQLVVHRVDEQMRRLLGNNKGGAPQSNSELRFLVAVKITALCEMISFDLTQNRLCAVVTRLDALRQYLVLFHRHTLHFAAHFHVLCGASLAHIGHVLGEDGAAGSTNLEAALVHYEQALQSNNDAQMTWIVKIMKCVLWWNASEAVKSKRTGSVSSSSVSGSWKNASDAEERFRAAMDDMKQLFSDVKTSVGLTSEGLVPRLKVGYGLLCGAASISECDYPAAIAQLKSCADLARRCFGMNSTLLSCALRLLAVAHHLAGARDACDVSIATSMQLSQRCRDESGLLQCLQWTLNHMVVSCEADSRNRDQLARTFTVSQERAKVQATHADGMAEAATLRSFHHAGSEAYRSWVSKVV